MTPQLPTSAQVRAAIAPVVDADVDEDRARRIFAAHVWSCVAEPGDGVAGRIVAAVGAETALIEVAGGDSDGLAREAAELSAQQWSEARNRWMPRLERLDARIPLDTARRAGLRLIVPEDEHWPAALGDLGVHAPFVLWVRGAPDALTRAAHTVALVGARASTSYGEHVTTEIAAELCGRGVGVISGAAFGIDGAAHRAALLAGGTTIAVLAGGVDRPYPRAHAHLLDRIATTGAVISEVPCGSEPTKWRFLQRNRVIAALGDATVVVEAGHRSGSLNTAGHAAAMSRPLGAVPGPVTSAASAGCHRLLREYDARCVTSADDVLELIGAPDGQTALFDVTGEPRPRSGSAGRTDDATRVLDAMSFRAPREVAEIARRSGIAVDDASAILGLLWLEGAAVDGRDGWRRVRRSGSA